MKRAEKIEELLRQAVNGTRKNWKEWLIEATEAVESEPSKTDVSVTPEVSTSVETSLDNNKCWWTQESNPEVFPNLWRSGCGNSLNLDAEKPCDNHMKYCCYCGKEIAEG